MGGGPVPLRKVNSIPREGSVTMPSQGSDAISFMRLLDPPRGVMPLPLGGMLCPWHGTPVFLKGGGVA